MTKPAKKGSCTFIDGQRVALFYDGKFCRCVPGIIVGHGPDWVRVEFTPWASEDESEKAEILCETGSHGRWSGWLIGDGELGIMAGLGAKGDYYSMQLWPEYVKACEEEGYPVQ